MRILMFPFVMCFDEILPIDPYLDCLYCPFAQKDVKSRGQGVHPVFP